MSKRFMHVSIAIMCLALAYHLGVRSAGAQAPPGRAVGRYVVATGNGDEYGKAILLDSVTGNSWTWDMLGATKPDGRAQTFGFWHDATLGTDEALRIVHNLEHPDSLIGKKR